MEASIKIKAPLENIEAWHRFIPSPPNKLLFNEEELQFGRWIIKYKEIRGYEIFYHNNEIEFSIGFPYWMIDEIRNQKIFMREVEISKETGEATIIIKPLDHIHIIMNKEDGEELIVCIKSKLKKNKKRTHA